MVFFQLFSFPSISFFVGVYKYPFATILVARVTECICRKDLKYNVVSERQRILSENNTLHISYQGWIFFQLLTRLGIEGFYTEQL